MVFFKKYTWIKMRVHNFSTQDFKKCFKIKLSTSKSGKLVSEKFLEGNHTIENSKYFYKDNIYVLWESCVSSLIPARKEKYTKILNIVKKEENINTILDFGCGSGSDAISFALEGKKVYAYDINEKSKFFMKFRNEKYGTDVVFLDKQELNKHHYDLIVSVDVMEHLSDPFKFVDLICSLTDRFIFTKAFRVHEESKGGQPHHSDFSFNKVMMSLENNGFKKIRWRDYFPPQYWIRTSIETNIGKNNVSKKTENKNHKGNVSFWIET